MEPHGSLDIVARAARRPGAGDDRVLREVAARRRTRGTPTDSGVRPPRHQARAGPGLLRRRVALRRHLAGRAPDTDDVVRRPPAIVGHPPRHGNGGMDLVRRRAAVGATARPAKRRCLVDDDGLARRRPDRGPRPRRRDGNGHLGSTDRLPVGEAQRRVAGWHVGHGHPRPAEPHSPCRSPGTPRTRPAVRHRGGDGGNVVGVPRRALHSPQCRRHRLAQHVGTATTRDPDHRVVADATSRLAVGWRWHAEVRGRRRS